MRIEQMRSTVKRVVVFGGAGFIGSHLMASLLDRGYKEVVSADIAKPIQLIDGVRYVDCDVRKPIPLDLTDGPPNEVYNLAAVHQTPGHADHEYFETNVAAAENICSYCTAIGVDKLVFTSSIAVYFPSEEPKTENSKPTPISAYGKSKLEAEAIHRDWAEKKTTRRLTIVRPAVIFGPGEGGNFTRLAKALKNGYYFYPGRRNTIKACGFVGDLVNSIAFAVESDHRIFLYNFCYPKPYTIEDICETFSRIGGYSRPRITAPLPILLATARCFEFMSWLGLKNGIHRERVMKLVRSTNIKPDALIAAGFRFETDLADGLGRWKSAPPEEDFV